MKRIEQCDHSQLHLRGQNEKLSHVNIERTCIENEKTFKHINILRHNDSIHLAFRIVYNMSVISIIVFIILNKC